jgi:peptide deformylase
MALRNIRIAGDAVLTKHCREVTEITPRITELIDDMFDTMYDSHGVGLAAPQVGILKRIVVIDTGDDPHVLINPKITEQDGEQTGDEGCLSLPGKIGTVTRPNHVIVEALDREMKPVTVEGEGLLARAICHETDHLDGKMYMDLVEGRIRDVTEDDLEEDEGATEEPEEKEEKQ